MIKLKQLLGLESDAEMLSRICKDYDVKHSPKIQTEEERKAQFEIDVNMRMLSITLREEMNLNKNNHTNWLKFVQKNQNKI
jgi:hypothetical protein